MKTTYTPSLNPMGGTAEVTYTIRNRGNVRLAGTHQVEVSGPFGVFGHSKAEQDLPELLPGERYTVHAKFTGVPAAVLEQTTVHLEPTDPDAAGGGRSASTFAPPLTLVCLALASWLGLRARRAYRGHRDDDPTPPTPRRVEAMVG